MPPTKNRVLCEIETAFATLNFLDRIKLATINHAVFFVIKFLQKKYRMTFMKILKYYFFEKKEKKIILVINNDYK